MRELGKLLAWALRHEPHVVGLELDRAGWAEIDAVIACLEAHGQPVSRAEIDRCVSHDAKARFSISPDGRRIRAAQGHSVPVDLGLTAVVPPSQLFHGAPTRVVAAILERGLERGKRHDVHLSGDIETALEVGRRRGPAVLFCIDAAAMHRDGFEFRRSDNGVWLTERVPPRYLVRAGVSRNEWPVPVPEALELDLGDLRVSALAWGPPSGRPVLALHGWLDNAASFCELAPRLCEALKLRLVALDLPGHGLSQHKRGPYHFIDSVADSIHAADALGWERFALIGHSMGAGISTLVAGTTPERIDRCVLLEGIGPMVDDPSEAARRLARSLRVEARKQSKDKRLFESPEVAAQRLREATMMKLESARILIDRGLEQRDGGWTWRADPRLRIDSRMRLTEAHVLAFLQAIQAPVLLISAEQGWPHDPTVIRQRMASVAQLRHVALPGHHHVHLDDPEPVAAAIVEFFQATP